VAHISFDGFDELEKVMRKIKPETMAVKAVNKAVPILEEALKSSIAEAANRGYATGELVESVDSTPARGNDLGVFSVVKPEGIDEKGVRNVEKMAYLEYGVASHGQEPHPVRQTAIDKAKSECIQMMERVINEEVGKM
jgi:hypothetical protein